MDGYVDEERNVEGERERESALVVCRRQDVGRCRVGISASSARVRGQTWLQQQQPWRQSDVVICDVTASRHIPVTAVGCRWQRHAREWDEMISPLRRHLLDSIYCSSALLCVIGVVMVFYRAMRNAYAWRSICYTVAVCLMSVRQFVPVSVTH